MAGLVERLRDRIRRDGPMLFRHWMEACLYDADDGFYARGRHPAGVGKGTHFATSPTLHPFFAHSVARELAKGWKDAGCPAAWEVVEFGAGTGALARDAMWELQRLKVPARWSAIDVRPGPAISGGRWLAEPPAQYDAVVANEFLDALPFDVVESHAGRWFELGVGLEGDAFAWARMEATERVPQAANPDVEVVEGDRRVRMTATTPWLATLAKAGVLCGVVVDYGGLGPAHEVRAYHEHLRADPLADPGSVDLTADVDFEELGQAAADLGFTLQLETQERFLMRHGIFDALNRTERDSMKGTSDYLRLRQLLLPTGFGHAFKVAVMSRP
ncbi:MAG: SAM-dependent methyltransferase [Candidatus Thermoplasmatota archaeon]